MKPLFKWPGGKSAELAYIRSRTPAHSRYVEPFAGGAAVFFDLEPERAVLSDVNPALTEVYRSVQREPARLRESLQRIEQTRALIGSWGEQRAPLLQAAYSARGWEQAWTEQQAGLQASFLSLPLAGWKPSEVWPFLSRSLQDKLKRLSRMEERSEWSAQDLTTQLLTATHAGWYLFLRKLAPPSAQAERAARFIFLREFAYGGMFRYNRKGEFNIPYGGASYNRQDFQSKIERVCAPETVALMRRTEILTGSFERLRESLELREDDWLFLDPPYDSEFSEYERFAFGREEQSRLAEWYAALPCPALMIIGKSELTEWLYLEVQRSNPAIQIEEYERLYAYNMRGRNKREITHLGIRNYPLPGA